jgi:hypothetical protein
MEKRIVESYGNTVSDDTWPTTAFTSKFINACNYCNSFTLLTKEETTDIINYICTKEQL